MIGDPDIRELSRRVEVRSDEARFGKDIYGAEVVLEVAGETHTLLCQAFPGSAPQPLEFAGAANKLRRYAEPLVGGERVREITRLVGNLDQLEDVTNLARLIRA